MVVTGNNKYAAMRRAAIRIAVFDRVAGAIDTGPLAVPDAENAVDRALRIGLDLLRSQYCSRCKIFIDRRQKFDVALIKKRLRAPEFQVKSTEWRAAITTDKTGGIESDRFVDCALHQRDADQRLGSGEKNPSRLAPIAVIQFVIIQGK